MIDIQETEKLIATMRNQAQLLNTEADSMENMLVPFKNNAAMWDTFNKGVNTWMNLFANPNK